MTSRRLAELGGVSIAAIVVGVLLLIGTLSQLFFSYQDETEACYSQGIPDEFGEFRPNLESASFSLIPLGVLCQWQGAGKSASSIWPSAIPTLTASSGLLIAGSGIVVFVKGRRARLDESHSSI